MWSEIHPLQSPYKLCIDALTAQLEHTQVLLADLHREDEFVNQKRSAREDHYLDRECLDREEDLRAAPGFSQPSSPDTPRAPTAHMLSPDTPRTSTAHALSPCTAEYSGGLDSTMNLSFQSAQPESQNMELSRITSTPEVGRRLSAKEYDAAKQQQALERSMSSLEATTNETPTSSCRRQVQVLVNSHTFELVFAMAIFTNSMLIGFEVDWKARNHHRQESMLFDGAAFVYGVAFTIELVLRIFADGCAFFTRSPNLFWNYFDLVIVTASLYEIALAIVLFCVGQLRGGPTGISQIRVARLLRIARLMRFMRIVRITRFVEALRTMVISIIGTLRPLFWAMVLLCLFIYAFAIMFAQAATDTTITNELHMDAQQKKTLHHYWGNLLRAMLTLFASLTGGVSWEIPAWSLAEAGSLMLVLYLLFLVFTYFAVLNVLVAVFVQNAAETAQKDHTMIIKNKIGQKKAYIQLARQLFGKIDDNGSGHINYKELEDVFDDEEVHAYLESLELRVDCAWSLFKHLDTDDGQSIDLEEFVDGCLRLRGGARGIDLANVKDELRHLENQLTDFIAMSEAALKDIAIQLAKKTEGYQ